MEVDIKESRKLWILTVDTDTLEESPSIEFRTIKLDPSYEEWLVLYPNGSLIDITQ